MPDKPTLAAALRTLNEAAYAAIRAGSDTTEHPDLDRQLLRDIARATDRLVDDNAPPFKPGHVTGHITPAQARDIREAGRGHLLGD